MNIGLIGSGAIGQYLLKKINTEEHPKLNINNILVRNRKKYQSLEHEYDVKLYTDLEGFLSSDIDMVIETANVKVVRSLLPEVLKEKDAMLISVGALVEERLLAKVSEIAEEYNHQLHLPSGAIGGLDLIQNAKSHGNLESVELTTSKPAAALLDEEIQEVRIVFEGKASEAIEQFPANMNISIILALTGVGINNTDVRLVADPALDKNIHNIKVTGQFGEAEFTITNNPLPENPKTSALAALSILGTLERIQSNIKYGN